MIDDDGIYRIYDNQINMIKEQIKRYDELGDFKAPELWINPDIKDFYQFDNSSECKDVKIINIMVKLIYHLHSKGDKFMAANIKDEDERNRRIILVGEFIINNPSMSTRKIAKYFSDNYFNISNATVHDYLIRYKDMFLNHKEQINNIMNEHKELGIKDDSVLTRVKEVTRKFIEEDKTVEQIANELNVGFWTVYRDLKIRLQLLDNNLFKIVEEKLTDRSKENLNKNK